MWRWRWFWLSVMCASWLVRARRCSACPFTPSTPCSTASHAARCTAVCKVTVVVLGARRGQGASGQLPCQLPPRHRRDRWRCKRHRAPALSGGSIVHVVTGIRDTDASRGDATATHVFNTALLLRAVTPVCFPDTSDTPITMSDTPDTPCAACTLEGVSPARERNRAEHRHAHFWSRKRTRR